MPPFATSPLPPKKNSLFSGLYRCSCSRTHLQRMKTRPQSQPGNKAQWTLGQELFCYSQILRCRDLLEPWKNDMNVFQRSFYDFSKSGVNSAQRSGVIVFQRGSVRRAQFSGS